MAKGEWNATTNLINAAIEILTREFPMTIRQLFYRLVSAAMILNADPDYKRISKVMTIARLDGRVPWEWIVDRSRTRYSSRGWDNVSDLAETMELTLQAYRRDYWQDQPCYVEIWCEKDAVTGSIQEVRDQYGISVEGTRGFNSTSNVYAAAQRIQQQINDGRQVNVFYLGDFDPSGDDMERDLHSRISRHLSLTRTNLLRTGGLPFLLKRVAIFGEDIVEYKLPPLRVKTADPRARGFIRKYGPDAVELDALPPTVLRRRLRQAINGVIDQDAWDRAELVENAQRETCKRYAGVLRDMRAELGN